MTTYYAAIKYPVDASTAEKVKALRDGLELVAMELIEEHGCDLADVEEWLENAALAAEWSATS